MAQDTDRQDPGRFQTDRIVAIAGVHFIHDIYNSFLSPLLPLIIQRLGLTLTQAGSLAVCLQLPSLFNPFLGAAAERRRLIRPLLIFSPGVSATFMCLIGVIPSFGLLCATLLAAGLSVAALHVSAPVIVARLSGESLGKGMSFFMVGGELARTAGPLVAVWAVSTLGLPGLWQLMFFGWAASAVLWWRLRRAGEGPQQERGVSLAAMLAQMKRIIAGIFGILVARAFMAQAITTYLPTLLVGEGHSLWFAVRGGRRGGGLRLRHTQRPHRPPARAAGRGAGLPGHAGGPALLPGGAALLCAAAAGVFDPGHRAGAHGGHAGKRRAQQGGGQRHLHGHQLRHPRERNPDHRGHKRHLWPAPGLHDRGRHRLPGPALHPAAATVQDVCGKPGLKRGARPPVPLRCANRSLVRDRGWIYSSSPAPPHRGSSPKRSIHQA